MLYLWLKKILQLSMLLSGFLGITVFAIPVFQITTTDTTVFVLPGSDAAITYTVKNNSGLDMPQMRYFPPPTTTINSPLSTCNAFLANGASCTVSLIFHAPTNATGTLKLGLLGVCGRNGRACSVPNQFNSVHVIISSGIALVAAGSDFTGGAPPLLAASTNGGSNWLVKTVAGGVPTSGSFFGAGCTGMDGGALCVAVGESFLGTSPPLVAVSTDGARNWNVVNVPGAPAFGDYITASCTGSGSSAICAIAGQDIGAAAPIIAVTTNGGTTWATKLLAGAPTNGIFFGSSCTGTGTSAVCTVAGQDTSASLPLLGVSMDGGNSWAVPTISLLPASGAFFDSGCTGNGSSAICAVVGQDQTGATPPLLVISQDGGATWAVVTTITGAPASGIFFNASCTGSGSNAVCVAVGEDLTATPFSPALIAVSTDGGTNWAVKAIGGSPPNDGIFNASSCTGSGATAICVAAGQDLTGATPPLLAQSIDGGNTWDVVNIAGMPTTGAFFAASCTGSGATAICIAAGQDNTGAAPPFLVQSTNGGATWNIVSIPGSPTSGSFSGTGASMGKGKKAIQKTGK